MSDELPPATRHPPLFPTHQFLVSLRAMRAPFGLYWRMSRPDQLLLVGVVYTWGWLVAVVASGRFRPVDWLAGLLAALALPVY